MSTLSINKEEAERLDVLSNLEIMDTPAEKDFDDIVKLAAMICHAPISLITLLDENRQWFKAKVGLTVNETPREIAFCNYAILSQDVMIINDATLDERFKDNPLVTGPEQIHFYAGVPIFLEGLALGTLCVVDRVPRELTPEQIFSLRTLGQQVRKQLELRHHNKLLESLNASYKVQQGNLENTNHELYTMTQELLASEEEIRSTLEQVSDLQFKLEGKERQYRELVENASDLIYELDSSGHFSFVNHTMEMRSGFSIEELRTKFFWELVHKGDREKVTAFYNQQRKSATETSYLEFRMASRSGEEIWIGQNVRMFFEEKNFVHRVAAISRDITELKRTERKLEDSEKLYRLLSANSTDLISLFDLEVQRQYVSPSVKEILGYEPMEMLGKTPYEYIHGDDVEKFKEVTQNQTLKGKSISLEYRAIKKDGSVIWIESISNPLFDSSGVMTGFQTCGRDITKRKEFETSLKEAKEKAEEATHAKSQFLSMMSHEIRTPMNAIIGLTTLMLQNHPKPDQLESLELLKFSGENLLSIINDILDLSKIEADKLIFESIEVDLHGLVNNTKQILEQRANEKGIKLELHYDKNLPKEVKGDPVRLTQILINLVGNSIKFTEKGKITLSVKSLGREEEKEVIQISVRDTGIGIAPDKLEKVFERFSQAEVETTRKYGGTGLGLYITKSLLNQMGSDIEVQSTPGKGSVFSFVLRLTTVKSMAMKSIVTDIPLKKSAPLNLNILLVEDNKINQIVASGFLKKWGIAVDVANNGKEAVDMVKNRNYHLILMDLQMPEMDGYEACTCIRAMDDPYFKTIPIIALTASAMLGMKDKVLEVGMNDFVSKPFVPEELRATIMRHTVKQKKVA